MAKRSHHHPTLTYCFITWLLFPAAFLYTAFVALKYRDLKYFFDRLGFYKRKHITRDVIWCHCASVGEINTALPLLKKLADHGFHLLISTNTLTSHTVLLNSNLDNYTHIFSPLDYSSLIKKLISIFSPRFLFVFETEFWPSTILTTGNHAIPVAIINGRISDKTLHAPLFLRKNYQRILAQTCKILTSSQENTNRFVALGADKKILVTLDNLKFSSITKKHDHIPECPFAHPFLLCASTHTGEEELIIKQWKTSRPKNLGLVIAIRHPQRAKEVCKILEENNCTYCLHSNKPTNPSIDNIYIIDTIGELLPFMQYAQIVFMGGSLVPVGGHNVLEAAQFSKCIITGSHYRSIADVVSDLLSQNGIKVVDNAEQLMREVTLLWDDHELKNQIGINAKTYLDSKQNVLNNYQDIILKLIQHYSS